MYQTKKELEERIYFITDPSSFWKTMEHPGFFTSNKILRYLIYIMLEKSLYVQHEYDWPIRLWDDGDVLQFEMCLKKAK